MKLSASTSVQARSTAALALLLLVPAPTIGVWINFAQPGVLGNTVYVACKAWMLLLPVAWLVLVDRGRLSLSPLRRDRLAEGLGLGALLGLVIAGLVFAAWFTFGREVLDASLVREKAASRGIDRLLPYLGLCAYIVVFNSLMEEYVYRWFIFRKCELLWPHLGGWVAVLAAAAAFTIHHVVALRFQMEWGMTILCSAGVFIGGVVWSWCYLRYRSIWPGYLSHAIVDVAMLVIGWWMIGGGVRGEG